MNTLIYTTFYAKNKNYESLIWEWIISLRTLGNYQGEVLIFDYGMSDELISDLKSFKLGAPKIMKIENPSESSNISNWRNIDVIPYLEEYKNYMIAHFDADIWFQTDISILWDEISTIDGCYFGVEKGRTCRYRGPEDNEIIKQYNDTQKNLEGFVFGGWMGGKQSSYINKLKKMKELWSNNWLTTEWGTDQCMITYLIDLDNDNIDGIKYGCSHYFCQESSGKLVVNIPRFNYKYQNNLAIGVHIIAFNSVGSDTENNYINFRFKNRYREIWNTFHI